MGILKVLLVTFFVVLSVSVAFSDEATEQAKESDQLRSLAERSKELKSKDEAASKLEIKTNKWIPVALEKWVVLKANTEPYIQLVSSKSVELYKTAKIATAPHFTKFQEVTVPQVQKVKKISKPYIDQAADIIKKVHIEPYIQIVSSKPVELYKTAKIVAAPHITNFQEVTAPHIQKVKKISKPYIDQAADLIKKVHTEPYIQMVSSKPVELYKTAKIATAPHITKFQEVTAPHIQKVKKISKPYIDQAADLIKKVHTEPYIQMVSSKPVELNKTAKIVVAPHITKFQEVTAPHIQKVKKISKPYIDQAADLIKKVHTEPYIQMVSSKPVELYKTAKIATAPHITKFQEVTAPHIQKVKKISKPYIDQAADLIKKVHPEPYIQMVSSKPVELNKTAKIVVAPHITKFQEVTAPHIQKVKKISKPYINQVADVIKKVHSEPYIQMVSSKPVELYKTAKIVAAPHITKFQEVTAPHIQKVKKISMPYINQATDLIKKVHTEPYIQIVSSKPVELYKTAKLATAPHITKFQEVTAPHIQKVKIITKLAQEKWVMLKTNTDPYIQLLSSKSVELYKTAKITLKKEQYALEAQSIVSEDKSRELSAQLESFKRTNEEQKERIQKTERALKAAEEKLMRTQLEASAKLKHLHEVHGAWLPHWLATQMAHYMAMMSAKWNEHVKPLMDSLAICYVIHVFAETFLVARL